MSQDDMDIYNKIKEQISTEHNENLNTFLYLSNTLNDSRKFIPATTIPINLPNKKHAFVVLGNILNNDGTMSKTLIERLKITKKAIEKYPNSKIVVSGGTGNNSNKKYTESKAMKQWFLDQGISEKKIIQENISKDTVENALCSLDLLRQENIESATVITSPYHMNRALAIFKTANYTLQSKIKLNYIISRNTSTPSLKRENIALIAKDILRANDFWNFPSINR
ncbi:YdcF family protein [Enterococcus faecalis]